MLSRRSGDVVARDSAIYREIHSDRSGTFPLLSNEFWRKHLGGGGGETYSWGIG